MLELTGRDSCVSFAKRSQSQGALITPASDLGVSLLATQGESAVKRMERIQNCIVPGLPSLPMTSSLTSARKVLHRPDTQKGSARRDQLRKVLYEETLAAACGRVKLKGSWRSSLHRTHRQGSPTHKEPLLEQKRIIIKQILANADRRGHSWTLFCSGVQCKQCKTRLHSKSTPEQLRSEPVEPCSGAVAPDRGDSLEYIGQLIETGDNQTTTAHNLKVDKA